MPDEPPVLEYVRPTPKPGPRRPADTYTWDIVFWCVFLTVVGIPTVLALLNGMFGFLD